MEAGDGFHEFYELHRFKPSKEDAVTYFLPRLLAGTPLPHGADRLIRHADVYACEPRDLAAEYAPVPSAVGTGDRFFFTTCKHKSGKDARIARGAGAGTWAVQRTEDVYHEGAKAGELKHLSFKKGKASTGWVMEEYRCLLPEAVFAGGEKVLCKIHLAPTACAAARQESDAYKLRQEREEPPVPQPEPASAHAHKRPAPVDAAAADLSSCKKLRMAAPVSEPDEAEHEDCQVWFAPAAPVSSSTASTFAAEAVHDDTERLSCSWDELAASIGLEPEDLLRPWDDDWESEVQEEQTIPVEAENNVKQLVLAQDIDQLEAPRESLDQQSPWDDDWGSEEQTLAVEAENNIQQLVLDQDIQQLDIDQERPWDEEEADPKGCAMVQEEQALSIGNVAQLVSSIDWELSEELQSLLAEHDEEEAELYKGCNYNAAAANLHAPSLEGRNPFFSFGAVN